MKDTLYHRVMGSIRGNIALIFLIVNSLVGWPVILLIKFTPKIQSVFYTVCFGICEILLGPYFTFYYSSLHEELHQIRQQKGQPLNILEIGPGNGANLAYYPSDTQLTIIEKNPSFIKEVDKKIKTKYTKMKLVKVISADITTLTSNDIPDSSFDFVLGTHVLCCIQNDQATGQLIKRILKPGGKFFSLEIVQRDPSTQSHFEWLYRLIVRPLFRFIAIGCRVGTQLPQSIFLQKMGFDVSAMKTVDCPCLPTWFSTTTYGVAVKK